MSKTFSYFAYGSNLLKERLTLKNPSAVFQTIAKLQDYRLTFAATSDTQSTRWRGGAATIVEEKGSVVWGAVWSLNMEDMASLDQQEMSYDAFNVKVISPEGRDILCRTYQLSRDDTTGKKDFDCRPSPQYKDVIIRGAKQLQLPATYVNFLQDVEDNGYQGKVEVYEDILKLLNKKE